jgi:hypothetical protein
VKAAGLAVLLAAVAVAFADSSIVVLALPGLLSSFDVSIDLVAWVVTAYNLVLALGALAFVRVGRRIDPARLALAGAGGFLGASVACALAPEIWFLIAFRAVQGLGATLLLLGALPLVRGLARTPGRGSALWTGAGVFGAALGPALGGMLTDAFSWRAIFYAQAPVAALAVVAAAIVRVPAEEPAETPPREGPGRWAASFALALASAALVGLLFLAVIELIDVWRLSPLAAGAAVTTIPLATLAAVPLAARIGPPAAATGAILLAAGLAGMAFVPERALAWVVAALAIAGLGYGLLVPAVARGALAGGSPVASGALSVSLRHLGLVAGLLVLTPLLAADLTSAGNTAELRGISVVLDAPVPAKSKLRLAIDLAPVLATPAQKGLPDFRRVLAHEHDLSAVGLGSQLDSTVQATIGRSFRRSFAVAALFALLAGIPVALAARRPLRAFVVAAAAAVALIGAELGDGALAYGARPTLLPPCAHRTQVVGQSTDQRLVLRGLDLLACRLHETREKLVVHAAEDGVDAASLAGRVERLAKVFSHLP